MPQDNLRKTYDLIAKDYLQDHKKDIWDDDYIQHFVKSLPKNAKVLDLGCGPGIDTAKLSKSGLAVEGIDLSDAMIEIAKKLNPGRPFIQGDLRQLPYAANVFDGVFAKASLLHIPKKDAPQALDEIWRVLKPHGIVYISIKGGSGEGVLTENDYGYEYSRFFTYWKMDDFVKVLKRHKFSTLRSEIYRKSEGYTVFIKVLAKKIA